MSNTLLVHPNLDLQNIYGINLKVYLGSDAIVKTKASEAIQLLEILPNIDLIVTQGEIGNERTAEEIYIWLKERQLTTPIIIISKDNANKKYGDVIDPEQDIKEVLKACAKKLGVNAKEMSKELVSEFYAIPTFYFKSIDVSVCDIYQRSNGGEVGDNIFYKIFEMNKRIDEDEVDKLIERNVKTLFIMSALRLRFTNFFTDKIVHKMKEQSGNDEKFKSIEAARTVVADQIQRFGITPDTIKIADAAINETFLLVENVKTFKSFIKNLMKNTSSYIFQHSQIITYISFHIIQNMEWGTNEQKQKLSFVTFFHDITLNNDILAKVHSEEEIERLGLSLKEKEQIRTHAIDASQLIQKYHGAPLGADIIIKQHHGAYNGIWFKSPPSHDLSPLAVVFMVSEEFAKLFLANKDGLKFEDAINTLENYFPNHAKFRSVIDALKKVRNLD